MGLSVCNFHLWPENLVAKFAAVSYMGLHGIFRRSALEISRKLGALSLEPLQNMEVSACVH